MSMDTEPSIQDRIFTSTSRDTLAISQLLWELLLTQTPTPKSGLEVVKLIALPRTLPEIPIITLMISCLLICALTRRSV